MAQTRLEKFGTIYTRISSLLRCGVMAKADRPLWYEIYEAFPPKYEPKYDRATPTIPVKEIFYKEDIIRAQFHKDYTTLEAVSLKSPNYQSQTQQFLDEYNNLLKLQTELTKNMAYKQTLEKFMSSQNVDKDKKKSYIRKKE